VKKRHAKASRKSMGKYGKMEYLWDIHGILRGIPRDNYIG